MEGRNGHLDAGRPNPAAEGHRDAIEEIQGAAQETRTLKENGPDGAIDTTMRQMPMSLTTPR
jgi:hypothetical protein